MRTFIIIIATFIAFKTSAQSTLKTSTFTVKGNCEECKTNIENAADIKGVKILTWSEKTKVATVTYSPEKVSLTQIQEAIAKKGYDAGDVKGNMAAYNKLPKCCKYRDGVCDDPKK